MCGGTCGWTVERTVEMDDETTNGRDVDNMDYVGDSVANIGELE